ncbi:MAG TPA: hypothetical protein PKE32_03040, partial [Miltoncostaeaceae bacterium]|nr:hypothetical protein [Miltoncostaeaceae bacterium]
MSESALRETGLAPLVNNNEPQAQVIELLVAEGDVVAEGDLLCVVETSKATADVEAPVGGHVGRLRVKVGDMVDAGALICSLFDGPPPAEEAALGGAGDAPVRLTRKAEDLLREAGISDLAGLPTDRFVTRKDVEALIAARAATGPVDLPAAVVEAIGPGAVAVFGGGGLGRCVIELVRAAG